MGNILHETSSRAESSRHAAILGRDMSTQQFGPLPAGATATLSGLELMRGILAGKFPQAPVSDVAHFLLHEVNEGHAVFTGTPKPGIYNPICPGRLSGFRPAFAC